MHQIRTYTCMYTCISTVGALSTYIQKCGTLFMWTLCPVFSLYVVDYLHALHGLNGYGFCAYVTPTNRACRRMEEELRVTEQSMKSLNSSVTKVLQTKSDTYTSLMSGSSHCRLCCWVSALLACLFVSFFFFYALLFGVNQTLPRL